MALTFDPKKDAANLRKHGLSLSDAEPALRDPMAVTIEDAAARGEARFITIGMGSESILVVVWTERAEEVRPISVRKATAKEKRHYAQGI